jgi:hypothetical protein
LAFEEAATHYERALATLESGGGDRALRCELQIELGDALHRTGNRSYRDVLAVAASEARAVKDSGLLARVALARSFLGFVRPIGVVHDEVVALIEEALATLGEGNKELRARLLAALAAELTWAPEQARRLARGREAVETARSTGNPVTLMRVLMRFGFAVREPGDLDESLTAAGELVELAKSADDVEAGFYGHLWLHDALLDGCNLASATAALEAAGDLAARLQHPVFTFQVSFRRAAQAILTGRFTGAERLVAEADEQARRGGLPAYAVSEVSDVLLVWLAYEQGRMADATGIAAQRIEAKPQITVWNQVLPLVLAEASQEATARAQFDEFATARFASTQHNVLWLSEMLLLGRAAGALSDVRRAHVLYNELLPFSGRAGWNGMNAFAGPVDLSLGCLARTLGWAEEAEKHLANTDDLARQAGCPNWLARSQLERARTLMERGGPGDPERARNFAGKALAAGEELGMAGVAAQARELLSRP